ncbi:hypothetical protein HF313_22965 [Massilia atriviolacea]|uniref:Large polyvalent protein-associated domain-containing protein n=1 Tax=Massilia atriviolacea TaxID=2495579 RepID=A0A430HCM9_9BURK|nr:LPD7 domain-containing protein [Massilia atriviolacea]RSZ55260.1 hypothetical protein EJB06_30515 [Massilia atriviolacea]
METAATNSEQILPPSAPANAEVRTAHLLCELAERRGNENLERWKSKRALGEPHLSEQLVGTWVLADVATYHSIGSEAKVRVQNRIAENSFAYPGYAEALGWIDPVLAARAKPTVELIMLAEFFLQAVNLSAKKIRERIEQASPTLRKLLADSAKMEIMNDDLRRRLHWLPQTRIEEVHAAITSPTGRDDAVEKPHGRDESDGEAAHVAESAQIPSHGKVQVEVQAVADFIAANKGLMPWKILENIFGADENLQVLLMNKARMADIHANVVQLLDGISVQYIDEVQAVISSIQDRPEMQLPNAPETMHTQDVQAQTSGSIRTAADRNGQPPNTPASPAANPVQGMSDSLPGLRPSNSPSDRPEMASESPPLPTSHAYRRHSSDDEFLADVDERSSTGEPENLISADDESSHKPLAPASATESHQSRRTAQIDHHGLNGFSPGMQSSNDRSIEPIGDLLERMTYSSRKDGSVMYSIDDRPAFVDHGDQLLMVKGTDHDELAILGAILLAKEKYGGAFEITGNREFARRAIEVMLKYGIDVRLKNPEQHALHRELANKGETVKYLAASAEHPVDPIDLKAKQSASASPTADDLYPRSTLSTDLHDASPTGWDSPSPDASAPSPSAVKVDRLAGKLLDHGEAPFHNIPDNKMSYFVTLENTDGVIKTLWGVDLPRALAAANATMHDSILLKNLGQQPVEVQQPVRDESGKIIGRETIMSHRNKWEVSNFSIPDGAASAAASGGRSETTHIKADISKSDGAANARRSPQHDISAQSRSPSNSSSSSQPVQAEDPINRLAGTVVSLGSAPLHHNAGSPPSYFIELENADGRRHTVWGADLARATESAGVKSGHSVVLQNLGKKSVYVPAAGLDAEGKATKGASKRIQRVVWEVENTSRQAPRPKNASYSADQPGRTSSVSERDVVPRPNGAFRLDAKWRDESRRPIPSSRAAIPTATARAHRQRPGV